MTDKKSLTHFISNLQGKSIFRVAGIYAASGFAVLQLADILLPAFELPESLISYFAIAIVGLFPVVILLTWLANPFTAESIGSVATDEAPGARRESHLPAVVSTAIVILFLASATGYFWVEQDKQLQTNYENALIEIDALINRGLYTDAYLVMRELDVADGTRRDEYAERIVVPGTPKIEQDGVVLSFKPYNKPEVEWTELGISPFTEPVPLPRGDLQLKLELDGFTTRQVIVKNPGPLLQNGFYLKNIGRGRFKQAPIPFTSDDDLAKGFQLVPASDQPVFLSGWSRDTLGMDIVADTHQFLVQTYEVSNRDYKEFVAAGGYAKQEYWQEPILDADGKQLDFDKAMAQFIDSTGRPGPVTWSLSNYGEGEGTLPLGGISWYEAMAYANFRQLSLPTVYQWTRYALGPLEGIYPVGAAVGDASHFDAREPVEVHQPTGLGPWSTYNTAGNVREWVLNSTTEKLGIIQGSHWESYGNYAQVITAQKMNRHPSNGLRLVDNLGAETPAEQLAVISLVFDDPYTAREPVSEDAFNVMRVQFTAPDRSVDSVQIESLSETDLWKIEEHTISYTDGEHLTLYIFKPITGEEFRTVLYGPPANAFFPTGLQNRTAIPAHLPQFDYVLRGGRAVVLPIWHNSYERRQPDATDPAEVSQFHARGALNWYRDTVNAINYIEDQPDLNSDKLTYLAISYGAAVFGQLITALEPRISNSIFVSGGIVHTTHLNPLLDGINYLPRITQPVLMLNGDQDHIFKWEASSERSYELLGTNPEHKKLIRYDAGHISFSRDQMIKDVSDWMDQYAPVHRP